MKKVALTTVLLVIISACSWGQVQLSSPVSTAKNGSLTAVAYDWEVIGINPANLGWDNNHKLSFTLLDAGVSGQAAGVSFSGMLPALSAGSLVSKSHTWQQILGNGIATYGDINWLALSFRLPNFPGAFAVNVRDRIVDNSVLGPEGIQALNDSYNLGYSDATMLLSLTGTNLQYIHYREINFDYGSIVLNLDGEGSGLPNLAKCFSFSSRGNGNYAIYAGIGFKYLIGLANINEYVDNTGLNASYSITKNYPEIVPDFPTAPGQGYAFDAGLGASYGKWKFGVSATDIGSITWKHENVTKADTAIAQLREGGNFVDNLINGSLDGSQTVTNYKEDLPAKIRMGASYKLNHTVLLTSDLVFGLNNALGNFGGPYLAVGGEISLNKWVSISTGFAGANGYGVALPVGVMMMPSCKVEFYAGTADIASYLHVRNNTNISLAVWSFRYNL